MPRALSVSVLLWLLPIFVSPGVAGADLGPLELMERGQRRRAVDLAEQRRRTHPDDPIALRVLATLHAEQGRFDEATPLAERLVELAPKDPDAHFTLARVYGMHARASSVLKKPGLAGRFKKEADLALSLDPDHEGALESMIEFHREAPGIVGGDRKKVAGLCDRLIQAHPTAGWLKKADIAGDEKDSTLAENFLRKAVAAENAPQAKFALARWLAPSWRKPAEAERFAREAATAEPWRSGAWALIVALQGLQQRWAEVEATLIAAEAGAPGELGPHYQAARLLVAAKKEPARAEALLRRYIKAEPETGQPSHAAARWRLAQALEQQGRVPEALAELRMAIKLDSKLDGAKQDLKRLKG
jgi:tetratricopeptide (TPR) repeat protein